MVELRGEKTQHGEVYDYKLSQSYDGSFSGHVRLDLRETAPDDDELDVLRRFTVDYETKTGPDGTRVVFAFDEAEYEGPDTDGRERVSVDPDDGQYSEIGALVQQTVGDIKARANY